MKTTVTIEVKQLENIKGGKMNYLLLGEGEEQVIISVGEKTYNGVIALIEPITKGKLTIDKEVIKEKLK